jgi:hypothetical protein
VGIPARAGERAGYALRGRALVGDSVKLPSCSVSMGGRGLSSAAPGKWSNESELCTSLKFMA